jgi:hypothetical protein
MNLARTLRCASSNDVAINSEFLSNRLDILDESDDANEAGAEAEADVDTDIG